MDNVVYIQRNIQTLAQVYSKPQRFVNEKKIRQRGRKNTKESKRFFFSFMLIGDLSGIRGPEKKRRMEFASGFLKKQIINR